MIGAGERGPGPRAANCRAGANAGRVSLLPFGYRWVGSPPSRVLDMTANVRVLKGLMVADLKLLGDRVHLDSSQVVRA